MDWYQKLSYGDTELIEYTFIYLYLIMNYPDFPDKSHIRPQICFLRMTYFGNEGRSKHHTCSLYLSTLSLVYIVMSIVLKFTLCRLCCPGPETSSCGIQKAFYFSGRWISWPGSDENWLWHYSSIPTKLLTNHPICIDACQKYNINNLMFLYFRKS